MEHLDVYVGLRVRFHTLEEARRREWNTFSICWGREGTVTKISGSQVFVSFDNGDSVHGTSICFEAAAVTTTDLVNWIKKERHGT